MILKKSLDNVHLSLQGNFSNTIKVYPRMSELNGNISPQKINSAFNAGRTNFVLLINMLPGKRSNFG